VEHPPNYIPTLK